MCTTRRLTSVPAGNGQFGRLFATSPTSDIAPKLSSTTLFPATNLSSPTPPPEEGDVRALVYIDAFAPDEGEMTFSILGGSGSALDVPDPTTVLDLAGYPGAPDGDVEAFLKPETVYSSFAQDLSETDRWLIAAGQRPLTLSANTTPSLTAAWKKLPSWTVVGTEDRIIPPGVQRRMAQRAGATIREVAASHVSMISKPQATIDAILAAVAATSD
jgi:pimeloyl-ACP methyl ester carboxylesterase